MGITSGRYIRLVGVLLTILLSGCATNYQYMARGKVTSVTGEEIDAVIYWNADEGRLWYGKKYQQADTSVSLRVCQKPVKIFSLSDEGLLELQSKSGDVRLASLDDAGAMVRLPAEENLRDGSRCGLILVEGKPVDTGKLLEGVQPEISIHCKNETRPDRYPAIANYPFGAVERKEADVDGGAPMPCP